MILLKNEWSVKPIKLATAKEFVTENHYSKGGGSVAHACFGLFFKGDERTIHGVSVWNPPPLGASKSVSQDHKSVLSLSRFCLAGERPENAGSFLISKSIKLMDKRWKKFLTYADSFQNHDGGLYRASNWNYIGQTKKNPVWWDPISDCMVSRKKGKQNLNQFQMRELGYELKGSFEKMRFLYQRNDRKNIVINSRPTDELLFSKDGHIIKQSK